MCCVGLLVTLVPRALFCMCSVKSVLYVFSLIVWYVSALGTVLNVFCKIFT